MGTIANLVVKIDGDVSGFKSAVNNMNKMIKTIDKSIDDLSKSVLKAQSKELTSLKKFEGKKQAIIDDANKTMRKQQLTYNDLQILDQLTMSDSLYAILDERFKTIMDIQTKNLIVIGAISTTMTDSMVNSIGYTIDSGALRIDSALKFIIASVQLFLNNLINSNIDGTVSDITNNMYNSFERVRAKIKETTEEYESMVKTMGGSSKQSSGNSTSQTTTASSPLSAFISGLGNVAGAIIPGASTIINAITKTSIGTSLSDISQSILSTLTKNMSTVTKNTSSINIPSNSILGSALGKYASEVSQPKKNTEPNPVKNANDLQLYHYQMSDWQNLGLGVFTGLFSSMLTGGLGLTEIPALATGAAVSAASQFGLNYIYNMPVLSTKDVLPNEYRVTGGMTQANEEAWMKPDYLYDYEVGTYDPSVIHNTYDTNYYAKYGTADGTNVVPRNMVTLVHKGEAIVPKKYNPFAKGSKAISGGNNISITINNGDAKANKQLARELDLKLRHTIFGL